MLAKFPVILENVIPPRSRNRRSAVIVLDIEVDIPSLTKAEAPVALVTRERDTKSVLPRVTENVYRLHDGKLLFKHVTSALKFTRDYLTDPFRRNGSTNYFTDHLRQFLKSNDPWPDGIDKFARQEGGWDKVRDRIFRDSERFDLDESAHRDVARWRRAFEVSLANYVFVEDELWLRTPEPRLALDSSGPSITIDRSNLYGEVSGRQGGTASVDTHMFPLDGLADAVRLAREMAAERGSDFPTDNLPEIEVLHPYALSLDYETLEIKRFGSHLADRTQNLSPFTEDDAGFAAAWTALEEACDPDNTAGGDETDAVIQTFLEAAAGYTRPGAEAPVLSSVDAETLRWKTKRWNERAIDSNLSVIATPPAPR